MPNWWTNVVDSDAGGAVARESLGNQVQAIAASGGAFAGFLVLARDTTQETMTFDVVAFVGKGAPSFTWTGNTMGFVVDVPKGFNLSSQNEPPAGNAKLHAALALWYSKQPQKPSDPPIVRSHP